MNVHRRAELATAGKGTSSRTHFFHMMLPQTIAAMKLQIPRPFASLYWEELFDGVTITVQNGRKRNVRLEKVGQDIYLKDGWHQFVQLYSIKVGYFVVFKYKGNLSFEVSIFDLSATEVCYDQQQMDDDDDDEEEEDIQFLGSSSFPCLVPDSFNNKKPTIKPKRDHVNEPSKGKAKENGADVCRAASMRKPEITQKREKAMIAASAYQPENPFFMLPMRKYNVQRWSFITVPMPFAKTYFNLNPEVISVWHDGREWKVGCNYYRAGEMKIGKGWNKFVAGNGLKLGDVCVFELVQGAITALDVTVFRSN